MGQHLNQTVQTLRKKQEALPQTQSALVKLRRKKSKELPTQQMVKKGGLQNSFTLKHLRLMMGELKEEHTFQ